MRRSVEIPALDSGDTADYGGSLVSLESDCEDDQCRQLPSSLHTHTRAHTRPPKKPSQPRKRSWLYALPPYIRTVDLEREVIVLSNPEKQPLDLSGHYIVDRSRSRRFDFEDGYTLPPLADGHSA